MNYEEMLKGWIDSYDDWWNKGFATPTMTNNLYPYTSMFSPIQINKLKIKNRIIMAPMGNISMAEETGRPNAKMLRYFEERAKGGVGLITTGLVPVSIGIDTSLAELGDLSYFPRIDRSRTVFAGWRDLAHNCHAHGSAIFIQLTPGLGRVGNPQCLVNSYKFPVSSSFNPNFYIPEIPSLRLSDRKCVKIIKRIGQASADAHACTLDGVYLHGHEGYFLEQMSNTAFNRRKIGRFRDWQRFGIDMVKEIRKRVGNDYPIMYRIDLSLALNATYGEDMNSFPLSKFKNERKIEETFDYMNNLVKAGVDIFDVDLGSYDNWWLPHPPSSMPAGCYLQVCELVKKYFEEHKIISNAGLTVPIVGVGKLGYPDLAEDALRTNKCDMVMLGRPLLADPEWCNKAYKGETANIRPCIGCQEACINEFVEGGHPQCAVNARTAYEEELQAQIPTAVKLKKIAIIGAGCSGITSAEVLIAKGHSVDLYEASDRIGGSIISGSEPIIKFEFKNYLAYLNNVVKTLQNNPNFKILFNTRVSETMLKAENYDVIITACGASQIKPKIDGADQPNVVQAVDLLLNRDLAKGAKDIVIIGGGVVGCETGYFAKYELNLNVTIVEMQKFFMAKTCTANRGHIIHYLKTGGVSLLNCTKLLKINTNSVTVSQNMHKNVPYSYKTWSPILPENVVNPLDALKKLGDESIERELKADLVVLALGSRANDMLYYQCIANNSAPEIYNIGDSFKSAKVFESVHSAYRKALSI